MKRTRGAIKAYRFLLTLILLGSNLVSAQDENVEELYRKALEYSASGDAVKASEAFEKLLDLANPTLLEHEYGPQSGGILFDCAMTLIAQKRWDEAKTWLNKCINTSTEPKGLGHDFSNPRESLALFQLGFIESQLGNHEEALRLYKVYLDSKPPAQEWTQVRNSFALRKGTSEIQLGRIEEGEATLQSLFDNRDDWNTGQPFLMQGILELGLGWTVEAGSFDADQAKLEVLETRAHTFLDQNLKYVAIAPFDAYRFGFVERFRKLGDECTKAGLYSLGLRFFSNCPTLGDIRSDVNLRLARLPIGSEVPQAFREWINKIDEAEKAEIHPDAETLRSVATCYEHLGNSLIPRNIYWYLVEAYPEVRARNLHQAARFSTMIGDDRSAQYFSTETPLASPPA